MATTTTEKSETKLEKADKADKVDKIDPPKPPPPPAHPDDLKIIEGIGPKIADLLINAGSRTISKVDLNSFSVVSERSISTPNTYSASNPLYLAATSSGCARIAPPIKSNARR